MQVQVNRGWAGDPYGMMSGIPAWKLGWRSVLGYHSGAGTSGSPMAHTMEPQKVDYIEINRNAPAEFTLNAYMAGAAHGVPIALFRATRPCADAARRMVPALPPCLW